MENNEGKLHCARCGSGEKDGKITCKCAEIWAKLKRLPNEGSDDAKED